MKTQSVKAKGRKLQQWVRTQLIEQLDVHPEDVKQSSEQLENDLPKGLQGFTERQDRKCDDPWQTSKWMATEIPARPNEIQYEWEAPRVITKGVSECELGGTTNGFTNRVDRLRLLGNGVVPQTAAKAFETLIKRVL